MSPGRRLFRGVYPWARRRRDPRARNGPTGEPSIMSIVKSARDGAVVTITLDRASEGNLLPVDGVRELAAAFRAASATDAKVIVLRGNGADFCRGRGGGGLPSPT